MNIWKKCAVLIITAILWVSVVTYGLPPLANWLYASNPQKYVWDKY